MEKYKDINSYIRINSKSQFFGFLWTLFLGPLGLFYSSRWIAIIACIVTIIAGAGSTSYSIICWGLSIIISFMLIGQHNYQIRLNAELIQLKNKKTENKIYSDEDKIIIRKSTSGKTALKLSNGDYALYGKTFESLEDIEEYTKLCNPFS